MNPDIADRFWAKVDRSGGPDACWPWTAGRFKAGYGGFHPTKGTTVYAHRFAYELVCGVIPLNATLDHTCHNGEVTCPGGRECRHRRCVNPRHLEPVGSVENVNRSPHSNVAKTACPAGHPYDEANTYVQHKGRITIRRCRACARERDQRPERRTRAGRQKHAERRHNGR